MHASLHVVWLAAPTDLPGVLTSIARNLYVKKQFELSGYCLEAVIVLCKNASGDVQNTLLCALESLANVYSALDMHERALAILARHQTLATEMESWFDVASASALQAQAHKGKLRGHIYMELEIERRRRE